LPWPENRQTAGEGLVGFGLASKALNRNVLGSRLLAGIAEEEKDPALADRKKSPT
jgi:hypothetical protein